MTVEEIDYLIRQINTMSGVDGGTTVHLNPQLILPALEELRNYKSAFINKNRIDYTAEAHIA